VYLSRRYQYTLFPANGICRFHGFLTGRAAWKTVGPLIHRMNPDPVIAGKPSKTAGTVRKRFLLMISAMLSKSETIVRAP